MPPTPPYNERHELDPFILMRMAQHNIFPQSGHTDAGTPLHICSQCHGTRQGSRNNAYRVRPSSGAVLNLCHQCLHIEFVACVHCAWMGHRYFTMQVSGHNYCVTCYNNDLSRCLTCNRLKASRDFLTVILNGSHTSMCSECFESRYFACRCGNTCTLSESVMFRKKRYCRACHDRKFIQALDTVTTRYNKSKRLVGFEIEYFVPSRNTEAAREATEPFGRIKTDGSILPEQGYRGQEFASKITCGDSTIRTVRKVCTVLRRLGAKVNDSCGLHIHLDVFDETKEQRNNIALYWQAFEHVFFALVSASRRGNHYCRANHGEPLSYLEGDRYRALNIAALSKFGTFEVRLHQGTLDRAKIEYWIRLLLRFFETFSRISATPDRLRGLKIMSPRHRMILLMRALGMKLSERKRILKRIRQCNGGNKVGKSNVIWPKPRQGTITPTVELS